MKTISKTERKRMALLAQNKLEAAEKVLLFSKKRFKKFEEIITELYAGEDLSAYFQDRRIYRIHEAFGQPYVQHSDTKKHLRDTFIFLNSHSHLLGGEEHIQAISRMVSCKKDWIRDLQDWKPGSRQGQQQLRELAEYLFCRFPVPKFLYKVFLDKSNDKFVSWFIHIGSGGRVRDLKNVPIPYTQRMGHYFLQANEKFSVPEALRWAQIKGLGGSDPLAERIAYSWLSVKPARDEDFWNSFLALLAKNDGFDHYRIGELIDYVREKRRADTSYTLKGRTVNSLLRQSHEWHNQNSFQKGNRVWQPSGLHGLQLKRRQELVMLEELLTQKELIEEGSSMRHCVASYAFYCVTGKTTIFSMRRYINGQFAEKLATIEVNLALKRIVQAKSKMNKPISEEAREYLAIWAGKEELTIGPYL